MQAPCEDGSSAIRDANEEAPAQVLARRCAPGCLFSIFGLAGCATYYAAQLDRLYRSSRRGALRQVRGRRPGGPSTRRSNIPRAPLPPCATAATMRRASSTWLPTKADRAARARAGLCHATRHPKPTRLYLDAHGSAEWRAKGFHAVLNERARTPEADASLQPPAVDTSTPAPSRSALRVAARSFSTAWKPFARHSALPCASRTGVSAWR